MRTALGTAVFSGMLGVTFFGIFLTPVFYFVIRWITSRGGRAASAETARVDGHAGPTPEAASPAQTEAPA